MSILDLYADQADATVRRPLAALPRTAGERFEAEFDAAFAPDRYFREDEAIATLWDRWGQAAYEASGQRVLNPYRTFASDALGDSQGARKAAALKQAQDLLQQFPQLRAAGDPAQFEQQIAEEASRRRERAAAFVGTGSGFAAFAGGVAGESLTPHGLAAMFVPPARLATLPAVGTLRGFLASVGREAALQAGVGVGSQAAGELADFAARSQFGTEQTAGEIAWNVVGAGVGGALFGGGLRALHEGWRALSPAARAAAPTEVRDAAYTVERAVLDQGTNPLPPEAGALHEQILDRVAADIMRGRAARLLDDEVRQLDRAWEEVLQRPNGPPDDPLVRIQPADIDAVIVARGGVKGVNDLEVKGAGFGLVKFIFKHGPGSRKNPRFQISKDDLLALPRIVREFEPTRSPGGPNEPGREWRVLLPDTEGNERVVVFADKLMDLSPDRHLITVYVQEPHRLGGDKPLSHKKTGAPESAFGLLRPSGDTANQPIVSANWGREAPAPRNIVLGTSDGNRPLLPDTALGRIMGVPDRGGLELKPLPPQELARIARQIAPGAHATLDAVTARLAQAEARLDEAKAARRPTDAAVPVLTRREVAETVAATETPEAANAAITEALRLAESRPDMQIEVDGRMVSARKALEEADELEREAIVARTCAIGAV